MVEHYQKGLEQKGFYRFAKNEKMQKGLRMAIQAAPQPEASPAMLETEVKVKVGGYVMPTMPEQSQSTEQKNTNNDGAWLKASLTAPDVALDLGGNMVHTTTHSTTHVITIQSSQELCY